MEPLAITAPLVPGLEARGRYVVQSISACSITETALAELFVAPSPTRSVCLPLDTWIHVAPF